MATKRKLGIPRGVAEWQKLESIGDLKRFCRWMILSLRDGRLDHKDVAAFVQVGNLLARCIEGHDLEMRLKALEEQTANSNEPYE